MVDIDTYVVYIGFDAMALVPEKKAPVAKKPKPKTVGKPKQS